MKKLFIPVMIILIFIPTEKVFSLFGVGVYGLRDPISVDAWSDSRFGGAVTLEGKGFDQAYGFGGFLYIDAIPIIDLEANFELVGNKYDFQFKNALAELPPQEFGWGRGSLYITVRRKLFGLGVPVLGGVKLHAGGGLNFHNSTPLATIETMESLLGGDLQANFNPDDIQKEIENWVKDESIKSNGVHLQVGTQIKLLALNLFINYRLTLAKDVVPNADSFSSIWVGLALGL